MSQAPFRILHSSRPFHGQLATVRVDEVIDPEGRTATREVAEHPGAVAALVVDEDGRVLLVDQWRHAVGGRLLEIAAGKYDVDGETVEQTLRRELAEELGVEGGTLTWLASFYTTPGWSDEVLEVVRVPYEEALAMATGRPPGDSKTLVALGLYGLRRAGLWSPDPAGRPAPDAPRRRADARPADR
jgi:8-oxo-dGTP pyrophosphatase MutT (NUDIX family)